MSGNDSSRRVVVTGMGVVSPLGNDVETAFARLKTFENCVDALPELAEYEGLNSHLAARCRFERPAHYTRKVIKASLNADLAEDRMRRGQGTPDEYAKAQKIFDDLSKSSNFAACRRKPGESAGMGSLGEIILKLETQGYLDENPYTFPDDDIDKIIEAYQYTLKSVGMEIH